MAFQFGRVSALRSTGETVEQLAEQLRAERAKNAQADFTNAQLREELAIARKELAEACLELARRDVTETFARLPCASQAVH